MLLKIVKKPISGHFLQSALDESYMGWISTREGFLGSFTKTYKDDLFTDIYRYWSNISANDSDSVSDSKQRALIVYFCFFFKVNKAPFVQYR